MTRLRVQRLESPAAVQRAFAEIGVDPQGVAIMVPKFRHHVLRLHGVELRAAILLKQEALARGAEAAVARDVAGLAVDKTDLLLSGTTAQLTSLAEKLRTQPFGLKRWAADLMAALAAVEGDGRAEVFSLPRHPLELGRKTLVMGILNLTPDSFSDGGRFTTAGAALAAAEAMVAAGADLIDLGGESTRPGAEPVPADEELRRVVPIVEQLAGRVPVPLSVDTTKPEVAEAALAAGAEIVNDISGLAAAPELAALAARHGAGLILMHRRGDPRTMQIAPTYADLWGEVLAYLEDGIRKADAAGIPRSRLAVDPGFGFGKTLAHNLELLRHLSELRVLGLPVLVGTSRKSFIGKVLDTEVGERLEGTLATLVLAVAGGADFVRVHDVGPAVRAVRMADAVVRGNWE